LNRGHKRCDHPSVPQFLPISCRAGGQAPVQLEIAYWIQLVSRGIMRAPSQTFLISLRFNLKILGHFLCYSEAFAAKDG
jgi:hypothetical protein